MEFRFELALCAHLEATTDWVVARQLGGAVADPGGRIVDVCAVRPGEDFPARRRITDREIPALAIESDVGAGEAVYWRDAFDCHPDHARSVVDRAVDCGFFAAERRGGRRYVRQTARYPDWIDSLIAIENKPDLGRPGDLHNQLELDVALALFDEVILATESYVTRAHCNRLPEAVGIWRFDPETGERTVVRDPSRLAVAEAGIEPLASRPLRTNIAVVEAAAKAHKRRRIAERAYGKGWRTYTLPGCGQCTVTDDGRPYCGAFDRVINPAADCGSDCPGFVAADPPAVDLRAIRAERSPWVPDPTGVSRTQSGLGRFR
jgi:hypothetical protein